MARSAGPMLGWAPAAGAGLIVGATTILNAFAYAAFLATGPIAAQLPTILASMLVATAVTSLVLARAYSLPSALGGPAGNAAAVAGGALAAVVMHEGTASVRAADVAVVLALTALLPALVMLGLAAARLGGAIRFVPFPVVAGFLAGSGWLLLAGAWRMAHGAGPLAATVLGALGLRFIFARWKSPLAFPLACAGAIGLTWIVLAFARVPLGAARDGGWLFGRLPAATPALLTPDALQRADWGALANAWGAFGWVVIVVVAVSMLNGSLLEFETGVDERVDRDLVVLGTANLLAAATGGLGSQVALPTSLAAGKLAPGSRVPGYVVAALALVAAVLGTLLLPYLPRPVFGAIIGFYGIRFLEQYVRDAARAMTRAETAIAIAMVAATALLGLQTALIVGLVLACVLFVTAASRFPVVRRETTLRDARSRIERTPRERALLEARGEAVRVVRLQGHLFFGSARTIDATLRPLIDREPSHEALVLDFTLVGGVDISAALVFATLARRARRRGVALAFAGLTPAVETELRANGAIAAGEPAFADLAAALEAHETLLLLRDGGEARVPDAGGDGPGFAEALRPFVETLALEDGARLFVERAPSDAMYVLVAGRLAVERAGLRLRTLQPGALVGEMGFFTGEPRSADVVALGPVNVQRLSHDAFARIEREAPELLGALQRAIVRLQSERLRSANAETLALHV